MPDARSPLRALLAVVALGGCAAPPTSGGAAPSGRPSLLVVSLDTVSAAHLRHFGSGRAALPAMEELASRGRTFSNTWTPWPETGPAHWSMMTGIYPELHGEIVTRKDSVAGAPTLAEEMSAAGWATGAFIGGFTLTREQAGLDRGFQTWDEGRLSSFWPTLMRNPRTTAKGKVIRRVAEDVAASAAGWIGAQDGPWFAFVHFFDAHFPYVPEEMDRYGAVSAVLPEDRAAREDRLRVARDEGQALTAAELDAAAKLYDAAVTELDGALRSVIDAVGCVPGAPGCDVVVVVVADHGESFVADYPFNHRGALTPEVLHVPWVLAGPGVPVGEDAGLTSLLDVAPTLRSLLDLPAGGWSQGIDRLAGAPAADRVLYARTSPWDLSPVQGGRRAPTFAAITATQHMIWWGDGFRKDFGAPTAPDDAARLLAAYPDVLRGGLPQGAVVAPPAPFPFGPARRAPPRP